MVELGGRRMVERVGGVVGAVTGEPPLLVANAPEGPSWRRDLRAVSDVRPGNGSLGGIYTAVVSGSGPVLCVAWDMPFVTAELLQALRDGAAGCDAFLPESGSRPGGRAPCGRVRPAGGPALPGPAGGGGGAGRWV